MAHTQTTISVFLTYEEKEQIRRKAGKKGMSRYLLDLGLEEKSMARQTDIEKKYDHALKRLALLFRDGLARERILTEALKKVKADLIGIKQSSLVPDSAFLAQLNIIDTALSAVDMVEADRFEKCFQSMPGPVERAENDCENCPVQQICS